MSIHTSLLDGLRPDSMPNTVQVEPVLARGLVVFSGGSAANNLVDVFNRLCEGNDCTLTYIIPISDNGGSSSEIIRVLSGPGIGDIRSRLVRLIPDHNENDLEKKAIKTFFNHRLASDPHIAKQEWLDIVEARHVLWKHMSSAKRELIRSFLNLLNLEIVKRARPSSVFNFESASVGNMFLTGARLFSGSFESATYLLSSICAIPDYISVLPAINTNFSHHICASLTNGQTITGQNAISHPSDPTALPSSPSMQHLNATIEGLNIATEYADTIEDANWPGSLPNLRKPNIKFSKLQDGISDTLAAPIDRIFYINPYGQEIRPPPNPKIIESTINASCIVYSIGSLFTSIAPSLVLRGVGNAIANSEARSKVLILNGNIDRETESVEGPFAAIDFIKVIAKAALQSRGELAAELNASDLSNYVTHLIYLDGEDVPKVDRAEINAAGIECTRVYGRRMEDGKGCKYDEKALTQTLEAIIGRKAAKRDRSRRNTLEH